MVWLGHNCATNRKINRLHERCLLNVIYNDKQSSFEILLEKGSFVSIYNRNVYVQVSEMYKVFKGLSPPLVSDIFTQKDSHHYNL